jgi:PAS domain S-box-containing protein
MNQTLRAHLKQAFGLSQEALDRLLQESVAQAAPDSREHLLASGLGTLLLCIDGSLNQSKRDPDLKGSSLDISFDEISVLQRALDQHAIVSVTDTRGDILFVNDSFCAISGYSRDELIGQNHRIINSGAQPKAFFENLWATITSGSVWRGVICNRNKRGEHYWVQATIVPVLNADGAIERYIAARTDISARIKAESLIQQHSDLIEALFESIPLPVFVKDEQLRYVRGNDAFFDNTLLGRDAMIGKRMDELDLPPRPWVNRSEEEALLATGGASAYEAIHTLKDGKQVDLKITKAAIKGPDGKSTGLIGVIIDQSDIKQASRDLMAAKGVAESANRLKSDFLANMSHEIRTPMNGLIGMADLALNLAVDPTQREYLQIAKSSAMSLLQIINDILDFSKIEAGKLAIERIDFDMAQLLSEALRPMAVKAAEKGLELVLDIDDGFPAIVRGDPGRIRQILLNLVSNAIKFTMQGKVIVSASARLDGPTAHVDLSVIDTGVGIEAASLPMLFDPFTQEDSTITRRFGGTGLGLSITRRLSEAMGGSISVVSETGKGSHFSCLIPMAWSTSDSESFTDPHKAPGSIGSRPGEFAAAIVDLSMPEIVGLAQRTTMAAQEASSVSGIEVLLVEDNLVNQKLARTWLTRWGIHCTVAENGAVALERLSERRFDLILMDCQMPIMDGFEASARIRSLDDPDMRDIPIIAMTANAMAGDRERCLAAGMDDYISKPISTTYLKEAIERLARKREQFGAPLVTEFDYAQALRRADPDTISIIAESFIESMEADFIRMDAALSVLDWPEVMRLAHSAKGLCLTFHAGPLADDFARLTTMARRGGIDARPAQAILDSAQAVWPAFVSALLARLRTLNTGQQFSA